MHDSVTTPLGLLPENMRTRFSGIRRTEISQLTESDVSDETPFCTHKCGLKRIGNSFTAPVLMWHDLPGHERNAAAGLMKQGSDIRIDGLAIILERCEVYVDDIQIILTDTEYRILLFMAINSGRVLSHEQIGNAIWGTNWGDVERIVRSNINRLRLKLCPGSDRSEMTYGQKRESAIRHRFIRTVKPFGYIFV